MEKMMKKPEVEAVRFDDADVIATSILTVGNTYVAKGSEVNQARTGSDQPSVNESAFYRFKYNNDASVNNATEVGDQSDAANTGYSYAWYENYSWVTKDWNIETHLENGNHLPE